MLFRQLFDAASAAYSYLLAGRPGGEALIIDPVLEKVERYLGLLADLDLTLVKAIDTHAHSDHLSGLGRLRARTGCAAVMGAQSRAEGITLRVNDGDTIEIDGLALRALYTPGHTDDSYSFVLPDRVFTGDALLIGGRADPQRDDPRARDESIFGKLLKLPDETLVYPGHDHEGDTVSTIGEERRHYQRLRAALRESHRERTSDPPSPGATTKAVAAPAPRAIGRPQPPKDGPGIAISAREANLVIARGGCLVVDLREAAERTRRGAIAQAVHSPYENLAAALAPGGLLHGLASAEGKRLLFFCADGEHSAMAAEAARAAGFVDAGYIAGGLDAWVRASPAP